MAPPLPPNCTNHRSWTRIIPTAATTSIATAINANVNVNSSGSSSKTKTKTNSTASQQPSSSSPPIAASSSKFLISTNPQLIPLSTLNETFSSEMMYWVKPMPEEVLGEMLRGSLSLGVYHLGDGDGEREGQQGGGESLKDSDTGVGSISGGTSITADTTATFSTEMGDAASSGVSSPTPALTAPSPNSRPPPPALIGFARCITDNTTFLYLTDVYILPAYQGKGLGKWLISCVRELIEEMPWLRRSMAVIGGVEGEGEDELETKEAFYWEGLGMSSLGGGGGRILQARGKGSALGAVEL